MEQYMNLEYIREYLTTIWDRRPEMLGGVAEMHEVLATLKKNFVDSDDEQGASEIWKYEQALQIFDKYLEAYQKLKRSGYYDAWCIFESTDICVDNLLEQPFYRDDELGISRIKRLVNRFQSLYRYPLYGSAELEIKSKTCSICNFTIGLNSKCDHIKGQVYNGELCTHHLRLGDGVGVALTVNPRNKYSVAFPLGQDPYCYDPVKYVIDRLSSPLDEWSVDIESKYEKFYVGIGRNDQCPCDSGKKYKSCCIDKKRFTRSRYIFTIPGYSPSGSELKEVLSLDVFSDVIAQQKGVADVRGDSG